MLFFPVLHFIWAKGCQRMWKNLSWHWKPRCLEGEIRPNPLKYAPSLTRWEIEVVVFVVWTASLTSVYPLKVHLLRMICTCHYINIDIRCLYIYIYIYDPVIRDHGPPPQWYGGVRGRLSGPPPPHHRGEGSIYSIHCIYNIHHIHNIHNKHLLLHYIHYVHHHKPPPPHHRGEGSIYNVYIYIYMLHI